MKLYAVYPHKVSCIPEGWNPEAKPRLKEGNPSRVSLLYAIQYQGEEAEAR